jgi:hypothetical protein
MNPERDEDELEREAVPVVDPIRVAVAGLISAVMEAIPDGPARATAVNEIIALHGRIAVLLGRPRLN